jgi:hypothetical protein
MARLLQIFRAGRHVASDGSAVNFSQRELDEIAASYDPQLHEAPIVIGHPKENAPAFGWVRALGTRDGALEAMADQLDASFAEAVHAGRYKKISASFYRPEAPHNPTPGKWYLRHVGFLGAQPPAVKGLRSVDLADGEQAVEVTASADPSAAQASTLGGALTPLRDWIEATYGPEVAAKAIPEATLAGADIAAPFATLCAWITEQYKTAPAPAVPAAKGATADPAAPTADHAEPSPAEKARAAELARREAAVVARERELRRAEHVTFLEALVREGRPVPAADDVLGLFDVLGAVKPTKDVLAAFADGEVRTPEEVFRDLLKRLPKQVDFTERSRTTDVTDDDPRTVARAAQAHQAEQAKKGVHVSTADAVRAVKGGR